MQNDLFQNHIVYRFMFFRLLCVHHLQRWYSEIFTPVKVVYLIMEKPNYKQKSCNQNLSSQNVNIKHYDQ